MSENKRMHGALPMGRGVQGGCDGMTAHCFQERYMNRWQETNLCEEIALRVLRLNFGLGPEDVLPTGKGALSSALLDDPLESPPKKGG